MPNFSLEEIEDREREPADEEDCDHADQQPAGPAIASTSLSRSLSALPLHPLDVGLQENVGLVKERNIERKKRNFYVLLISCRGIFITSSAQSAYCFSKFWFIKFLS